MELNDKDEALIGLLRQDGRMSVSELARQMAASRTAVQMRLQKLERNGVIEGYAVRLSPRYLQARVRALVLLRFPPARRQEIEQALAKMPSVTALHSISGAYDMAGMVSAASTGILDQVLDEIGCLEGMIETKSSIILATKIDR